MSRGFLKILYIVKLGVDELNANSGAIRRAYNVNNIEISPIAVSQVYKPAGTIGDDGENLSTISIADLFAFVKQYDKERQRYSIMERMRNRQNTICQRTSIKCTAKESI